MFCTLKHLLLLYLKKLIKKISSCFYQLKLRCILHILLKHLLLFYLKKLIKTNKLKYCCNLVKILSTTTSSMLNFYYRVSMCLDRDYLKSAFSMLRFLSSSSSFLFFFVQPAIVDKSTVNSAPVHCSRVPQITLFSNFFIKNGSHGTIYTFKNYFVTVFSVFRFSKMSSIQTDPKYMI